MSNYKKPKRYQEDRTIPLTIMTTLIGSSVGMMTGMFIGKWGLIGGIGTAIGILGGLWLDRPLIKKYFDGKRAQKEKAAREQAAIVARREAKAKAKQMRQENAKK